MNNKKIDSHTFITKLTALWALSEAAFGGILHALKIPFTGLIVGGAAIIFISLIYYYSESRTSIIKSTMIVVIIKALISPHVPIFAHFAVLFQGLAGYFILSKKFFKITVFILAFITMLFSAFQMIVSLTIIFGKTFWDSINIFGEYVLSLFNMNTKFLAKNLYLIIIGIYIYLHILGGIVFGLISGKIPGWISEKMQSTDLPPIKTDSEDTGKIKIRRNFLTKPKQILLAAFLVILLLITYSNADYFNSILIMIIRSSIIISLWFFIIAPKVKSLFKKFLGTQKSKNADEVAKVLEFLPKMKLIVKYSWQYSKSEKKLKRIKLFISNISFYLIDTD